MFKVLRLKLYIYVLCTGLVFKNCYW